MLPSPIELRVECVKLSSIAVASDTHRVYIKVRSHGIFLHVLFSTLFARLQIQRYRLTFVLPESFLICLRVAFDLQFTEDHIQLELQLETAYGLVEYVLELDECEIIKDDLANTH